MESWLWYSNPCHTGLWLRHLRERHFQGLEEVGQAPGERAHCTDADKVVQDGQRIYFPGCSALHMWKWLAKSVGWMELRAGALLYARSEAQEAPAEEPGIWTVQKITGWSGQWSWRHLNASFPLGVLGDFSTVLPLKPRSCYTWGGVTNIPSWLSSTWDHTLCSWRKG